MYMRPATACGGGLLSAKRVSSEGGVFLTLAVASIMVSPIEADFATNEPVLTIRAVAWGIERVLYRS